MVLGQHYSPISGDFKASSFTNFMPQGFPDDTYFGQGAVIDSMVILLSLEYAGGDTTVGKSTLNIYEVAGYNFNSDSTYYSNFDMSPYVGNEPLLSYEIPSGGVQCQEQLPLSYAQKFFDNRVSLDNIYNSDTLFHQAINGLYFEVVPPQGNSGALYNVSLGSDVALMWVYYDNDQYPDSTLVQRLYFTSPSSEYEGYNTHLMLFDRDYTTADVSAGGIDYRVINDTINPQEKIYVVSPAGVNGKVDLQTNLVDQLKATAKAQGFNNIAVHRAELQWDLVDTSYESLNESIQTLAMYYDYNEPLFMPDYDYTLYLYDSNSYPLTIEGYINRITGKYVQNITRYVQQYLSGSTQEVSLDLAPAADSRYYYGNSVVWGSEAPDLNEQPKLVLTYTFVK